MPPQGPTGDLGPAWLESPPAELGAALGAGRLQTPKQPAELEPSGIRAEALGKGICSCLM